MRYGLSTPALNGDVVTQGHTDYCRDNGHATYRIAGVGQGWCPRCGAVTTPATTEAEQDTTPTPVQATPTTWTPGPDTHPVISHNHDGETCWCEHPPRHTPDAFAWDSDRTTRREAYRA